MAMTVRPATLDELEPLILMCRSGKLFEVQEWIRQGKPIAMPVGTHPRRGKRNPLRVCMDAGFHSLVQVLLDAGAPSREGSYDALAHAVELRRADLVSLLIEQGADVNRVSMRSVIETGHAEIIDLFLSNGASLVRDNPIAWGLIRKVRPTLGLLKRFAPEHPELMRQADIALRHHAAEGNSKWVALMLWAGANPWARGTDRVEDTGHVDEDERDGGGLSAMALLIIHGRIDILRNKKLLAAIDPARPEAPDLIRDACHAPDSQVLHLLLERGHSPRRLPDRGTAAIGSLLHSMSWDLSFGHQSTWSSTSFDKGIDSSRARERMKMLHMIVAQGARWLPDDPHAIGDARRCLLKMAPAYVLEFVWLMQRYTAARRRDVQELLRTPAMVRHLSGELDRAVSIASAIPDDPPGSGMEEDSEVR